MRISNRRCHGGAALAAVVALVLATACASEDSPARTESITESTTAPAPAEPARDDGEAETADAPPAAPGGGTVPEEPAPAGQPVTVGDWQVSITETTTDAAGQVQAANQFNDPPSAGNRYVMGRANLVYHGEASATPWADLDFKVLAAGNTYGGFDDRCGVLPDSLNDVGEMFSGATASGNVCVSVPAAQLSGAVWMVDELLSFGDSRAFIAIK